MHIVLLSDPDIIEAALQTAEKVRPLRGLKAPTGDVMGKLEELWEHIREGLHSAYLARREQVCEIIGRVMTRVETLLREAGEKADELRRLLLDRLSRYLHALVDNMLSQVRAELPIEGAPMKLSGIEVSQTIALTGSVQLSIERVFDLTSNGELSVSTSYVVA